MTTDSRYDIAVLGGGILGIAVAAELAERNTRVVVIDSGDAGNPASLRSFAWLNSASSHDDHYHYLRSLALQRHLLRQSEFARHSPYSFAGTISWARDGVIEPVQGADHDAGPDPVREAYARLANLGHAVTLAPAEALSEIEPAVAWEHLGPGPYLHAKDEGWVDLAALHAQLTSRFLRYGGHIRHESTAALQTEAGRVSGVRLTTGTTISAREVVVAAGAATPALLAAVGISLPARTNSGSVILTAPVRSGLTTLLRGPHYSARPAGGGRLLVHATAVDEAAEFDGNRWRTPPDIVDDALAHLADALVAVDTLTAESVGVGERPIPADGLPVVGRVPGLENTHVLFSHSGATLSLLLGDLLATEIVDPGTRFDVLEPYRPGRFTL